MSELSDQDRNPSPTTDPVHSEPVESHTDDGGPVNGAPANDAPVNGDAPERIGELSAAARRRRRGSRGGQRRRRGTGSTGHSDDAGDSDAGDSDADWDAGEEDAGGPVTPPSQIATPGPVGQGPPRRPQIGDTRPAPPAIPPPGPAILPAASEAGQPARSGNDRKRRRRGGRSDAGRSDAGRSDAGRTDAGKPAGTGARGANRGDGRAEGRQDNRGGRGRQQPAAELSPEILEQRRGKERKGRPVGRYFMCVQVRPGITQVSVLEGRNLIEHYVSRPADDVSQIHGNIYVGKVQNVLPGMEAAFVDIGTPKNAVLYRGDLQYDPDDVEEKTSDLRIEQILKQRQLLVCQVTKNPIGAKGARLTQEVSLPGRFVVLIPNSGTYGISKRLPDDVRKRLRGILDRVKPAEHGLIVRTAAEHATEEELRADMTILLNQWNKIAARAANANRPMLLHREPDLAVRVIREEFNSEYRGVVIDDRELFEEVRDYVAAFNPELADRIEYYNTDEEGLSVFERHHVHEQVHKALDRKVWLPSGGSLIIEHTEALSVIDVNTGKNVGSSNLEATVFHNNLEAAEEIAKQLRLRDIGGIIVIDFIDMEIKANRAKVLEAFRAALARDKTRTQVFDISELGLVEMTRKRIGEGLLTEFSQTCPDCHGRGVIVDSTLLN
jgi:ribonuclease E